MATTSLMPLHVGKGRSVGTAISDIIDYVENPDKTEKGNLSPATAVTPGSRTRNFSLPKSCISRKPEECAVRTM